MNILLDTCTFIWFLEGNEKVPVFVRELIEEKENDAYVSLASLWEIEIKHSKKPQTFSFSSKEAFKTLEHTKIKIIDVKPENLFELNKVVEQNIHNDPFDHLLLSTAKSENLTLLTHDSTLKRYEGVDILCY